VEGMKSASAAADMDSAQASHTQDLRVKAKAKQNLLPIIIRSMCALKNASTRSSGKTENSHS
jgi:hypothetical protein